MEDRRKLRVKFNQKTGPVHLEGLVASWGMNDDPPICPNCMSNRYVEWVNGEWACSRCDIIVEPR